MTCRHSVLRPVIGHQDDGDGGLLELRNCVSCGSTVSREVGRLDALATGCACSACDDARQQSSVHPRWCACFGCEFRRTRAARLRQARCSMTLDDFDAALASLYTYAPAFGPLEFYEAADALVSQYLREHPDRDAYDSADVMAWIGVRVDDADDVHDIYRWQALERRLVSQLRDAHCESDDEGEGPGEWMPRAVIDNCARAKLVCVWCEHDGEPEDRECRSCGVSHVPPLAMVEALRMSVAVAANDGAGGAA